MKKMAFRVFTINLTLFFFLLAVASPASAYGQARMPLQLSAPDAPVADEAILNVRSTGEPVTVAQVTGRMVAAGGNVIVSGISWKDLCVAPCKIKLEPGLTELMITGDGVTSATKKLDLRPGDQNIVVKPGSSALSLGGTWLTALGISAVLAGAVFLTLFTETTDYHCDVDPSCPETKSESATRKMAIPVLLGGALSTGLGIFMISAGRTSIELESSGGAPPRSSTLARSTFGLRYGGSW